MPGRRRPAVIDDLDEQRLRVGHDADLGPRSAPAYLLAFVSDSLTMKYAASSIVLRQLLRADVERDGHLASDRQ